VLSKKNEWLTPGTFLIMAVMITFAGFKLPHYINIIFPATAVLTSAYLIEALNKRTVVRRLFVTQLVVCTLCVVAALAVNVWAFPLKNPFVIVVLFLLLILGLFIFRSLKSTFRKTVGLSVLASTFIFYLLNSNFYPQLLTYQAGNELALATRQKVDPKTVYFWPLLYSPSFQFYNRELKKVFTDSILRKDHPVWILTDRNSLHELQQKNLPILQQYSHYDYNIGTMSLPFINPATRKQTLDTLFLSQVK